MADLICLANSRKNTLRCIAGMTADGVWIRPVSTLSDGGITWTMRQIDGREPELLDVLSIPLAETGPDFGHQPENRSVVKGPWSRTGKVAASEVKGLCEKREVLLHTDSDRVPVQMVSDLVPGDRYSLQLIHVKDAAFCRTTSIKGKRQYRARFTYARQRYDMGVTCHPLSCFPVKATEEGTMRVQLVCPGTDPVALKGLPVTVDMDRTQA